MRAVTEVEVVGLMEMVSGWLEALPTHLHHSDSGIPVNIGLVILPDVIRQEHYSD